MHPFRFSFLFISKRGQSEIKSYPLMRTFFVPKQERICMTLCFSALFRFFSFLYAAHIPSVIPARNQRWFRKILQASMPYLRLFSWSKIGDRSRFSNIQPSRSIQPGQTQGAVPLCNHGISNNSTTLTSINVVPSACAMTIIHRPGPIHC